MVFTLKKSHSYGKSPSFVGKSTIFFWGGIFNSYVTVNYQKDPKGMYFLCASQRAERGLLRASLRVAVSVVALRPAWKHHMINANGYSNHPDFKRGWKWDCRDIHALRKDAPPHGLSELSKDLNTYKTFDKVLQQTLTLLDKQAAACAHALPFNAIYGPWEGGIDSRLPPKNTVPTTMPAFNLKIVSWNIRGALSTSSRQESHGGRMLQLVSTLHSLQVSLAVISDPCFGPGMRWPRWTGYEFFGQRTTKNNTVAILVAIEILHYVEVIPDVGDPRALWVQVHTSESDGPEFLLLAMYAPPSNYMPKERLDFFASRVTELCSLRSLPKFASLPLLLAGDLNIHMHEICEKNAELERPVDRDIGCAFT